MGASAIIGGIMGGASLGMDIFGMSEQREASKARIAALRNRMTQVDDQTRQEKINQMEALNKTLARQAAMQAAGGGSAMGPSSFNFAQIGDFNQLSQATDADDLNNIYQKEALEAGIRSTAGQERAAMIGDIAGMASTAANMIPTAFGSSGTKTPSSTSQVFNPQSLDTTVQAKNPILDSAEQFQQSQSGLSLPNFNFPEI